MRLYVVPKGTPAVVVFNTLSKNSCASFLTDAPMVFEENEYVTSGEIEYLFKRGGKEYYFPATDVKIVT
jgi:hypothetical protein